MNQLSIESIADGFGLSVESVSIPDHENAIRVYKGAHQIFIGTEEAVREFLATYKQDLPTHPSVKKDARGLRE